MADRGAGEVSELKVSGHTMALEPGLYCVFNAHDGPVPSNDTGLPGVRVTASPGQQAGDVAIVGFEANGWIGPDAAALIRVTGQAARVMVTVYQEPNTTRAAPKLQVVRLSPDPAPTLPATQPVLPAAARRTVEVVAHVYGKGDVGGGLTDWVGEPGSTRWIEGFAVAPACVPPQEIEYQVVLGRGWLSPWAEGGQFCGSRGMSLPILGMRVKLRGRSAGTHRIQLHASFVDGTRIGPVGDGDPCEAPSLAALEAFQVAILPVTAAQAKPKPDRKPVLPAAPERKQAPRDAPRTAPKPPAPPGATEAVQASAKPKAPRRPGPAKPAAAPRRT